MELDPFNSVALFNLGLLHVDCVSKTSSSMKESTPASPTRRPSSSTSGSGGSGGRGSFSGSSLKNKVMSDLTRQSYEKAGTYWKKLVEEVETNHVNGLRRLARLEMMTVEPTSTSTSSSVFSNPKLADKRYVLALTSLHSAYLNSSSSESSIKHKGSNTTAGGGGSSKDSVSSMELDGLISEVLSVMDKAPAKFDQSRILAEKLKRR